MAKKQTIPAKKTKSKRVRSVAIDEQNPASTDVQSMIQSLKKRKARKTK